MKLAELLEIERGVTAVIGGGGKTGLMHQMAAELGETHTVICCTTTKIWPPAHLPVLPGDNADEVRAELEQQRILCLGEENAQGKLTEPKLPMGELCKLADYVLVEADGSAGHPMKAHAQYEPVLPEIRNQTILVVGAAGFGRPIIEAAHRPERYAEMASVTEDESVTPGIAARVIQRENLHDRVFINQAETGVAAAQEMASYLACPVVLGSLWEKWWRTTL